MKIVLLGATKGMGRALARRFADRGDETFLLGRNRTELEASAEDLKARAGASFRAEAADRVAVCDLEDPDGFASALETADKALGGFDAVVVSAALFGSQDALEEDLDFTRRLVTVNLANTIVFCELARKRLLSRGGGTLCVFSSVAGERGRKPVGIYGASKAGLSHYLESLDHKYRSQGLRTLCVKPGFVRTGMTEGLEAPPFAGEPEGVAERIVSAIDRGVPVVYAPAPWALIMAVIRLLPRFVMRRIGF